jgi:hypothetical protein
MGGSAVVNTSSTRPTPRRLAQPKSISSATPLIARTTPKASSAPSATEDETSVRTARLSATRRAPSTRQVWDPARASTAQVPNACQISSLPQSSMFVHSPTSSSANAATEAASVPAPSRRSRRETRTRAAAPTAPVELVKANPMLESFTRSSTSPNQPARSATIAVAEARDRPATSAHPAKRRMADSSLPLAGSLVDVRALTIGLSAGAPRRLSQAASSAGARTSLPRAIRAWAVVGALTSGSRSRLVSPSVSAYQG